MRDAAVARLPRSTSLMNSAAATSNTSGSGLVADCGPTLPVKLVRFPATYQQHLVDSFGGDHTWGQMQYLLESQAQRHEGMVVPPQRTLAMVREPPHAEIEQSRGAWRHAEYGTALEHQMVLHELVGQALRLITPLVTDEIVERRPERGVQRRRQQQRGPGPGDPRQLRQCTILVLDVLDDVERAHQIEYGRTERQCSHLAECDLCAAAAQLGQRRCADVDELRA